MSFKEQEHGYYDSPLHWPNVQVGKAYVETYLGEVMHIIKKLETDYDDYFVVRLYTGDDFDKFSVRNIKYDEDGWLTHGFADWEEKEIDPKAFDRMVIKSYMKREVDDRQYHEEIF